MSGIVFTSPEDMHYNCIAWAAEDVTRFRWPLGGYWPPEVERELTIETFIKAYGLLGYEPCSSDEKEQGFQKIAIFARPDDKKPTHAARQLDNGRWTSKLGPSYDIEHDLHTLTADIPALGPLYGDVVGILRRRIS